jgi:hypothetical protein
MLEALVLAVAVLVVEQTVLVVAEATQVVALILGHKLVLVVALLITEATNQMPTLLVAAADISRLQDFN